jgi:1L-myo-inositol 1-phosphate cytidylyltransferase / CDP-L-myo-inositol myo-inositolphosphotransferase
MTGPSPGYERTKPSDSLALRYLNRLLSAPVTRLLLRTPLTPTAITILSFLTVLLGAGLIAIGDRGGEIAGGLLIQAGFVLDCCDGEVARARRVVSERGALLDTILDRYADLAIVAALVLAAGSGAAVWVWGYAAAAASMLIPYINALRPDAPLRLFRRAERVLVCALAAAAGVPLWALVIIAVVGNLDAARVFLAIIRSAPGPARSPQDD